MKNSVNPFFAWLRSLPGVLSWPIVLWTVPLVFVLAVEPEYWGYVGVSALYGMVVHFGCYLVFGLPIYFLCWESRPGLWTWAAGVPLGFALGAVAMFVILRASNGPSGVDELGLLFPLIGGIYGMLSAAAAINSRGKVLR